MKIASDDPRWNIHTANLSGSDRMVLSPPLDLTPKGASAWTSVIQAHLLGKEDPKDRAEFLEETRRSFGYVKYLFKGRKALHKFLDDEWKKFAAQVAGTNP